MAGGLRINVLGPMVVTIDGVAVPLAGRRLLGVLAALIAGRPESQTVDRLIASVWADDSGVAANAVQYQISRLRRALEPPRSADRPPPLLVHTPAGYRLQLDRDAVDVDRFAALAQRGRQRLRDGDASAAATDLDDALRLARSRPYDDVADLAFLAPEITRLTELVRTVAEDRLRAWQMLGLHPDVVAAAQQLTANEPLREPGWALLATSLAAEGRQADALQAIRTVRRILADELGLDPGPELVDVERAILTQQIPPTVRPDPADGLPPLPAPATELVGRDDLVDAVLQLCHSRPMMTLTGAGGVGKTRVALEVVHRWPRRAAWVELAPYSSADDVVPVIAEKIGRSGCATSTAWWRI